MSWSSSAFATANLWMSFYSAKRGSYHEHKKQNYKQKHKHKELKQNTNIKQW